MITIKSKGFNFIRYRSVSQGRGRVLVRLFTSILVLFMNTAFAATLSDISLQGGKTATTLKLRFSSSVGFHHFMLDKPRRLVFDFDNTDLTFPLDKKDLKNALLQAIRVDQKTTGHLRLVLDVEKPVVLSVKSEPLSKGYMLHLTLTPKAKNKPNASSPKTLASSSRQVESASVRDVIIEIDPGHGGKDPGAIGQRGTKEKYIVLAIAKRLKRLIDKTPGMKARLTRHGDYYVGLRKRLSLAREHGADVFISIHADAYKNRQSHGVSVFALSQRGATSEAARWIAEKENYSELGGVDLSELNDESGLVRSVLIDLSQTATIGASLKLGEDVLENLDNLTVLHHEGVEQARFVVLKSPDIPSILIETGFISNRAEEKLLSNNWYQEKVARSILTGVKRYFAKHPPNDTYMARRLKSYRVVRGDSLSKIANKFRVSVDEIKKLNRLSSAKIAVGQVLILPQKT